ncbi:hypothetical protein HMPREF0083_01976 [Aneurinibacillus aneurinilyticus ATCC 12856]|uniref:Uncharacterized protein n=1 Tax=Aneurinibacillus aneurinilyticus ATCC 12856 TaxID=649747 RepID=U1WMX6_ANEAE|nr:hypothetical protein HMPREF0083_01976 [Aneurinibacillus aneurinilyticus ATCC 12856]
MQGKFSKRKFFCFFSFLMYKYIGMNISNQQFFEKIKWIKIEKNKKPIFSISRKIG